MESDDNVYDYQTRIKSLPKVKYSSLTEREKLWMAYNFSYTVCEDFPCGQFAEWMNDQWYGILLRLLKDCGAQMCMIVLMTQNHLKVQEVNFILIRLLWIYSYYSAFLKMKVYNRTKQLIGVILKIVEKFLTNFYLR